MLLLLWNRRRGISKGNVRRCKKERFLPLLPLFQINYRTKPSVLNVVNLPRSRLQHYLIIRTTRVFKPAAIWIIIIVSITDRQTITFGTASSDCTRGSLMPEGRRFPNGRSPVLRVRDVFGFRVILFGTCVSLDCVVIVARARTNNAVMSTLRAWSTGRGVTKAAD